MQSERQGQVYTRTAGQDGLHRHGCALTYAKEGIPRGAFASRPNTRFMNSVLKPKLWLSSCIASVMEWLIVPPIVQAMSSRGSQCMSCTATAKLNWIVTAAKIPNFIGKFFWFSMVFTCGRGVNTTVVPVVAGAGSEAPVPLYWPLSTGTGCCGVMVEADW